MAKLKLLTKTEAAYLAGVIDGEGCLSIIIHWKGAGHYGISAFSDLSFGCTDKAFMEYVAKLCNAKVCKVQPINVKWKARYQIKVAGKRLRYILIQTLPYLRCKKKQAEILLEYLDLAAHKRKGGSYIYWQNILDLYEQIKPLNKKGVS